MLGQLVRRGHDGVVESRAAASLVFFQGVLQQVDLVGEGLIEVILVAEINHENFILRVAGAHEITSALATLARFSRIDPELSITMPSEMGMSSWRKDLMTWGLPSSKTA